MRRRSAGLLGDLALAAALVELSLPSDLPLGPATLTVVASGFASSPAVVTVTAPPKRH